MYAASIKNEFVVLIHKCEHYSLLKGVAVLTKCVDLHILHGICMWYLLQTHNKNSTLELYLWLCNDYTHGTIEEYLV